MDRNRYSNVSLSNKIESITQALLVFACLMSLSVELIGQSYSGKSNSIEVTISDPDLVEKTIKPTIKWIYPAESTQSVSENEINLKLGIISETPVVKMTLIVNNEVAEIFENFNQVDPGYLFDAWVEKTVELQSGSNDLLLIVQNELGALRHQRKIEVDMSTAFRRDHALIFASDEYDSWDDLQGPVRDAEKIARVLEEKGYNIEIIRNFTTFDLLAKLEEYVLKEFQPHDQLFVYFAGHGYYSESTGEGFYVCKNSVNLGDATSTYIAYSDIKSIVNNIPAQHIFMLMDAVKGTGQPLNTVFEEWESQDSDSSFTLSAEGKTRIGILSGGTEYNQSLSQNAGSELSNAFITYFRKSEQTEQSTWGDLLQEFQDIDPMPMYVEFGDHSPGFGFNFNKSNAAEN